MTLKDNERLIGLKSCGGDEKSACHFNLQWIIGRDPTKSTLLKLKWNRNAIFLDRSIRKLPDGVMREVVKYLQY